MSRAVATGSVVSVRSTFPGNLFELFEISHASRCTFGLDFCFVWSFQRIEQQVESSVVQRERTKRFAKRWREERRIPFAKNRTRPRRERTSEEINRPVILASRTRN